MNRFTHEWWREILQKEQKSRENDNKNDVSQKYFPACKSFTEKCQKTFREWCHLIWKGKKSWF